MFDIGNVLLVIFLIFHLVWSSWSVEDRVVGCSQKEECDGWSKGGTSLLLAGQSFPTSGQMLQRHFCGARWYILDFVRSGNRGWGGLTPVMMIDFSCSDDWRTWAFWWEVESTVCRSSLSALSTCTVYTVIMYYAGKHKAVVFLTVIPLDWSCVSVLGCFVKADDVMLL